MPPPWALAATKATKTFLQREEVDEGTFNALSLTLAASLPSHLTTPAKGWTGNQGNQKVEDVLDGLVARVVSFSMGFVVFTTSRRRDATSDRVEQPRRAIPKG